MLISNIGNISGYIVIKSDSAETETALSEFFYAASILNIYKVLIIYKNKKVLS